MSDVGESKDDRVALDLSDDPVLAMWGVGRELWLDECGDAYVARERAGWGSEDDPQGSPRKDGN